MNAKIYETRFLLRNPMVLGGKIMLSLGAGFIVLGAIISAIHNNREALRNKGQL